MSNCWLHSSHHGGLAQKVPSLARAAMSAISSTVELEE
jgi:hypothetical protein